MVFKNEERKTLAINKEFWEFINRKRKKEENLEDCLRRLIGFKLRKRTKSKLERSLVRPKIPKYVKENLKKLKAKTNAKKGS